MVNDILRPELLWLEGRCYRLTEGSFVENYSYQEDNLYEDEMQYSEEDDDFEVTTLNNSRYSTSFHIPQAYLGYVIGRKGATRSRIEHDTKTTIQIPKQGQTGEVVIVGPNIGNVKTARRRLNMIVTSSRQKQKCTHFVSIPLNYPNIMQNFEKFKEAVLRDCQDCGIDETLFISPAKLHITIGVMALMDSQERAKATELLAQVRESIILPMLSGRRGLPLRVGGLAYMNDDPSRVHVLYARVHDSGDNDGLVQRLADEILEHFKRAGFMFKEFGRDNVKLHVTLMNSSYRPRASSESADVRNQRAEKRIPFDASKILETFADYEFGECEAQRFTISQTHSTADDGSYLNTSVVNCYD